MPDVVKTVLVPYSAHEMFALVSNVESYPSFLPWCGGASVEPAVSPVSSSAQAEAGQTEKLATVQIAFKGIKQSFTTRNEERAPEQILMTLHDGPFKTLRGAWRFQPLSDSACKVSFELHYQFSSRLLSTLVGPVFSQITGSFVEAFVARAQSLYGPRS